MRTTPVVLEKFGGMNYLTAYSGSIEDTELKDAVNVFIDEQGVIRRRHGFDQVQSVTGPGNTATILSRHTTGALTSMFISSLAGVSLVSQNGSITTWTEATLTNAKASVQFDSNSYIFSYQTQQMAKVDSLGNRTLNFANVQASHAVAHKNRLFTTNLYTGITDRIRYSQLYTDPTNPNFSGAGAWPAANTIDVSSGDGEPIVAMVEYNDNLIIFKKTSTWILYTDGSPLTSWKLQKLNDNIGCTGVWTPRVIGSLLYFMGVDGIYRTDGTTFEEISRPISNVWRLINHNVNTAMYNRSAIEWDGLYIVNPDWSDQEWYVFNTKNDTWTRWHVPQNFSNMVTYSEQPTRPIRMMKFGNVSAELWESNDLSGYLDGEASPQPFDSELTFKLQDFAQPEKWKYIPQIEATFQRDLASGGEASTSVQLDMIIDNNNNVPITNSKSLSVDVNDFYFLYRFKGPGRCRYLQVIMTTAAQSDFGLQKLIFHLIQGKGAVGYAH